MRTKWSGVAGLTRAAAAALLAASAASAQEVATQRRDPYPGTLQFGTGLINIPVAWVSPASADAWVTSSGKYIAHYEPVDAMNFVSKWNTNLSIDTHWLGRFSVGVAAYSQNPEWGFFGQVLLIRDNQFAFLPGVAIGVRNLGRYKHEDRLLVGHDLVLRSDSAAYDDSTAVGWEGFSTSPTVYGVATKEFNAGTVSGSFTLGYGNGIFSDDGGLDSNYNMKGQIAEGLFLGGRVSLHPTLNTTLTLLAENDGWDWNAGVVGDWRGIYLGFYATELEEGSRDPAKCAYCRIYNYLKMNVSLGYSGNIIDISRGILLRTRITELTREQQRLRNEIGQRERRIRGLETALARAQAGELAEIAKRREALEQQIQEEREQIRRAQEQLERLQGRPPATPPPNPPSNPPSSNPPSAPTAGSPAIRAAAAGFTSLSL
jgi:hypothetical protein